MPARDPNEPHRAATTLELFYDLVFVVAVGQAAASLHHAIVERHASQGLLGYALVFLAIWWAWMNWTWFASAFDNDDVVYRISAFVQMFGVLVLAAGVSEAFDGRYAIVVIGYVIMRLAMVAQWLRAGAANPALRTTAVRYAVGITAVQLCWIVRLLIPAPWALTSFLIIVVLELLVPWWAERARPTPWHPHHIAERYGLFTIIVLGEVVLAATIAVKAGAAAGAGAGTVLLVGLSGFVIVCAMWWLYNSWPAHPFLSSGRSAFAWGYGHYFIFSSIAAFGAGLGAVVDFKAGRMDEPNATVLGASIALPVAVFLLSVWLVHIRPHHPPTACSVSYLVAAVLVALTMFTLVPLELIALILVAAVVATEAAPPGAK
ncbi:low temperature requirement protein A [Nonomuraea sp. NPDC059194]|uniref:low temperature requirement protein A n=1 Tax=Nonomuraea sp. NPDC059194 TaxID=3346764 RepID=UPI003681393A